MKDHEETIPAIVLNQIVPVNDTRLAEAQKRKTPSIFIRTSSYGLSGIIIAFHLVGDGMILSTMGPSATAAASVVSTMQSVTIGTSFGLLLSTGIQIGKHIGLNDHQGVKSGIKTGWICALSLGMLSTCAFLSTVYTMPLILEEETATAVSDFFKWFSIAPIPDLMIMTNGLIIFQVEKNWEMNLLSTALYRIPAVGFGWLFGKTLGFGPSGVGMGGAVAAWMSFLTMQPWFLRKAYKTFELHKLFDIPDFKKQLFKFLNDGWKLALQRITEWGNLAAITMLIGEWNNNYLSSEQPSIQMLIIFNLFSQNFAQAAMMIATQDCAAMNKSLAQFHKTGNKKFLDEYHTLHLKNRTTFYRSNLAAFALNALFATGLYFSREQISSFFLQGETTPDILDLAGLLLEINAISLLPDAIRIVSGGVLRGWGDLLIPTLASLILMTFIGIPVGASISNRVYDENIIPIFIARTISILLSALYNWGRFNTHDNNDDTAYEIASTLNTLDSRRTLASPIETIAHRFNLDVEENIDLDIFAVVTDQLAAHKYPRKSGNGENALPYSAAELKDLITKHIQANRKQYQFFNFDTALLTFDDLTTNELLYAFSRALNVNIINVKTQNEPFFIKRTDAKLTICIGTDVTTKCHYSLKGSLTPELTTLLDHTRIDKDKSGFLGLNPCRFYNSKPDKKHQPLFLPAPPVDGLHVNGDHGLGGELPSP